MQIDSNYTLAAWQDIQSAIDHFVLREDADHRRRAVLALGRAVESLLREKLRRLGDPQHERLEQFSKILEHLEDGGVYMRTGPLWKLRPMRNAAVHKGYCPDLASFELVAGRIFGFLRRFVETELDFALDEVLEYHHAEVLRGHTPGHYERAKLFSIAANRDVHDNPRLAEEFAARAVDSAIRALALGCGVVEKGKTFAELIDALYDVAYEGDEDCAPYYPLGEDYHLIRPDFLSDPPISSDADPREAFVALARQTVVFLLRQVGRPKWEAAIREKWPDILSVLARKSADAYLVALQLPLDSISVRGDKIYIRLYDAPSSHVPDLQAHMEDAIREIILALPMSFGVETYGVFLTTTYGASDDDSDE